MIVGRVVFGRVVVGRVVVGRVVVERVVVGRVVVERVEVGRVCSSVLGTNSCIGHPVSNSTQVHACVGGFQLSSMSPSSL